MLRLDFVFIVVGVWIDLVLEFQKTRWMRYKKRSIWGEVH